MVERTMIRPPSSRLGPVLPEERRALIAGSPLRGTYEDVRDRESAYEILARRAAAAAESETAPAVRPARSVRASTRETASERFVKNLASSAGRQIGNMIIRGILGGLSRR
jgi:DNA helicase HerA-like ATPase